MLKPESFSEVALLTGGSDRPYVFGLVTSLLFHRAAIDLIGSDELDFPEFRDRPGLSVLKLRGNQNPDVRISEKITRISAYYLRLLSYAASAKPKIFHILWNNRFELFDRTFLMLYYKLLGKKIVLTAHNVNADKRDGKDTRSNRLTLGIQYRLCDHIFVHTEKMKAELLRDFKISASRVTAIPFGINNAVPHTSLSRQDARQRLGIGENERTVLFFGRITLYKGIEYLVEAFRKGLAHNRDYRLVIAGKVDRCEKYWAEIREDVRGEVQSGSIILHDRFVADEETEVYFKAADVLVLPYRNIYQSGVLFLAHSFGLPVLAADVGSLTEDIVEGQTGFTFKPEDSDDLARAIERYFASDLFANLEERKQQIREYSVQRHSWDTVAKVTMSVYDQLLGRPATQPVAVTQSSTPLNVKSLPQEVNADSGTQQVGC